MKTVTIVGARPQFIKLAPVSRNLREAGVCEVLVHTGQHYDPEMSEVFFRELDLPNPDFNLEAGSGSHGLQTGRMLAKIESVLLAEKPDWVMVYGDTNSTLAGALAAAKLQVPVAHVEAGLRSFNRRMPEELNRVLTDHMSTLLFCPTQTAVQNLAAEGVRSGVYLVGDVMWEGLQAMAVRAKEHSRILSRLGLTEQGYFLATIHRAENTDDPAQLRGILSALRQLGETVVFPVHPRTRQKVAELDATAYADGEAADRLRMIEPVGYLDLLRLASSARMILTDSGGLQKEACWLGVPCVTLREETEWVETVEKGCNVLAGTSLERIIAAVRRFRNHSVPANNGDMVNHASSEIVRVIMEHQIPHSIK